ncbi:hypothetical protein JCM10207_006227 [Rhodosporidiobolus poonsookiae]
MATAAASTSTAPPAEPPARAQLLATSPEATLKSSLETASSLLHSHLPVAFPTETVYGLGASALSSTAVKRIFAAKGRPSDNPLIVHVSDRDMLEGLLPTGEGKAAIPRMFEPLMKRFWPGALSLVFPLAHLDPKGKGKALDPSASSPPSDSTRDYAPPRFAVAPEVTASQPSLCLRMPSHPLALALIRASNLPLAAPSANLSSRPSPTTAAHVMADLGEGRGVGAVLDGGECEVGVESTVVDWVAPGEGEDGEGALRILRAGGVTAEEIEACLRDAGFATSSSSGGETSDASPRMVQVYARDFRSSDLEAHPTTPGMKYAHYAPGNAKVVLVRPVRRGEPGADAFGPLPSLQDLVQITALTHARVSVGKDGESREERFRVGLMLTEETLAALGGTEAPFSTSSPSAPAPESIPAAEPSPAAAATADSPLAADSPHRLVRRLALPPAPPSLFSTLTAGEESNLPSLSELDVLSYPLGSTQTPIQAAQRLFAGLRWFDSLPVPRDEEGAKEEKAEEREGVDLILVEAVKEEGVGLAVMERARKAAGGLKPGGEMEFLLA